MMANLVFDADDTLWMNEWQYSRAYADFFTYLYSQFGRRMPNLYAVKARFAEIDRELFSTWGVRRGRVAEAMLKTYEEIRAYVATRGIHGGFFETENPDPEEEQQYRIAEIGDQPFNFRELKWLRYLERALDAVGRLQENTLCLLTSYDANVWKKKRRFMGIGRYFGRRVRAIPGKKTAQDFIAVSGYRERPRGTKFYAIGNGPCDILPALDISEDWYGIYVPHGSTSAIFQHETGASPYFPPAIDHPRVMNLPCILNLQLVCFEHFFLRGLWGNGETPCPACLPGRLRNTFPVTSQAPDADGFLRIKKIPLRA